jgi:predicted DNA-binding transcriptional regulator YafY
MTPARATRLNVPSDEGGWTVMTVPIESVEHVHAEFLLLGADIEVLKRPEPRERIARTVTELPARYGNSRAHGGN